MQRTSSPSHVFVLASLCEFLTQAVAADKPNVLLIITDDQGYGDLGAHGNTMIRTPHLDRLRRIGRTSRPLTL